MILILMVKMVKVMNKVVCDKCKDEFGIKIQTKNKGDLQATYFECPKCHEEYIVNVTDENLRKDINKAIELRNKMLQDSNNKKAIRDYYILKNNNLIRGKQLKEEYLGD